MIEFEGAPDVEEPHEGQSREGDTPRGFTISDSGDQTEEDDDEVPCVICPVLEAYGEVWRRGHIPRFERDEIQVLWIEQYGATHRKAPRKKQSDLDGAEDDVNLRGVWHRMVVLHLGTFERSQKHCIFRSIVPWDEAVVGGRGRLYIVRSNAGQPSWYIYILEREGRN